MRAMRSFLGRAAALFFLAFALAGCTGSKIEPYGTVDVDLIDAPAIEYLHVYITVNKIAFHASPDAGNNADGWQVYDISAEPVTIDLAQLINGKLYADTTADKLPLFSGVALPVGTYRQIRLFLAPTEDKTLARSAIAQGLLYNNQATFEDGSNAPVRLPNSGEGIKLIPETPLVVAAGKNMRLALDFNLMDDMFDVYPEGQIECILKPRLGFFDMGGVGAIKGKVVFSNSSTPYLSIKAEQVVAGRECRVVRRTTTQDEDDGSFNLYPLPVLGNNDTAVYDILLRGRNMQTVIVKNVKVNKGTSLTDGAVDLGTITMNPGSEFSAQLAAAMHPSGAWLNFYQTLATDPVPFVVDIRHLNPYTGKFATPIELPSSAIQVYDFSSGSMVGPIIDATTSPGSYFAVTEAVLYGLSGGVSVSGESGTMVTFTPGTLTPFPSANRIDAAISVPASTLGSLNRGYLFITSGGLIIDCYQVDALMAAGGGSYTIPNLPGGTLATSLPGAYYDVIVLGWDGEEMVSGSRFNIDLTTGDSTASITMVR